MLIVAIGVWDYLQPLPAVAASSSGPAEYTIPGSPPSLPWPDVGSAAVGASGLGLIATSGAVAPAPTASLAKVMTALVVLADKPLSVGESGPTLVITDQDVATYKTDAADQQSVVPVTAGERLSEFQALEALLVPSGNNIAETLARWDGGSEAVFVVKMNARAAELHLTHTTFADSAGVSIQTVSTPSDLIALGIAAMQQSVVAQIVGLPQTTLPVAGVMYNVNSALGQSGIIGIKTGFGFNLGANFLFAADATADGQPVRVFGCLMGQPTLDAAFTGAEALIAAMKAAIRFRHVVSRNGAVGEYATAWGTHADLLAMTDVTLVEWPGMTERQHIDAPTLVIDRFVPGGTASGQLRITLGDQQFTVPLVTASPLEPPGLMWRLWRIPA